ncbi:MAG TPA: hypothetical protein VKT54_07875, partial [Steroidobacteraceae bacterium]|nr:hypothetical protein [Steroidobacteraceae bacterium]
TLIYTAQEPLSTVYKTRWVLKVTPTSKAAGDLALLMATAGLSRAQLLDAQTEVAFPRVRGARICRRSISRLRIPLMMNGRAGGS